MDYFSSFFQNVKDRLTNPFFFTFLLVILIHHWEFWYIVFNIDAELLLNDKLSLMKAAVESTFSWKVLFIDLCWTLLAVIAGYAIVILSRSLSLGIEHRAMPKITQLVIDKKIVLKEFHDQVARERDTLFSENENLKVKIRALTVEKDQFIDDLKNERIISNQKKDELKTRTDYIEGILKDSDSLKAEISVYKDILDEQSADYEKKNNISSEIIDDANNAISTYVKFIEQLSKHESWKINPFVPDVSESSQWNLENVLFSSELRKLESCIKNGKTPNSQQLNYFINNDVIFKIGNEFRLTPYGQLIIEYYRLIGVF